MFYKLVSKFVTCVVCRKRHTITFTNKEINKQVTCPYCGAYNVHSRPQKSKL